MELQKLSVEMVATKRKNKDLLERLKGAHEGELSFFLLNF
jgi:hypothetical protein